MSETKPRKPVARITSFVDPEHQNGSVLIVATARDGSQVHFPFPTSHLPSLEKLATFVKAEYEQCSL